MQCLMNIKFNISFSIFLLENLQQLNKNKKENLINYKLQILNLLMSFSSPTNIHRYPPQSPNVHSTTISFNSYQQNIQSTPTSNNRSSLTMQMDKSPQYNQPYPSSSQRQTLNINTSPGYDKISNEIYKSNNNSNPILTSPNTQNMNNPNKAGSKLTEMSSDLAKLKQQLSKIMSQSSKYQKKPELQKAGINNQNLNKSLTINSPDRSFTQNSTIATNNHNNINGYTRMTQGVGSNIIGSPSNIKYNNYGNSLINQPSSPQRRKQKVNIQNQSSNDPNRNQQHQQVNRNIQPQYKYDSPKKQDSPRKDQITNLNVMIQQKKLVQTNKSNQAAIHQIQQSVNTIQITNTNNAQVSNQINSLQTPKKQQNVQQQQPLKQSITQKSLKSYQSHELVVSRLINEQLSKKLEQNQQIQQIRKKKHQQQRQYQQKIIQLQHQKRKLKHQLNNLSIQKENIQLQLKTQKTNKQTLHKKFIQLQQTNKTNKFELQQIKTKYKLLQRKYQQQVNNKSNKLIKQNPTNFDQALKQQYTEINKYKTKLEEKDQEIVKLKDLNTTFRREIDSLHNLVKIQQLKATSSLNQLEQKHSIVLQDKENQIKTHKNLIATLQSKLEVAVKENKNKDAFMVQHLTGKVKTNEQKEYVQNFFKKYEVQWPSNKFGDKINEQMKQIQKLKKTILQMATNRKL